MKRQLHRTITRLAAACVLIITLNVFTVHADDPQYFTSLYACDNDYYSSLGFCQSSPNYPVSPDEPECRYQAYSSYWSCTNMLPSPSYELDFCDNARAARDNCVNTYLLDGDYDTYYTCRAASGIDQCE